ncbi:MAG: glucan biosynthesis protein G [Paracoccaceae bacterium]|nr:glucan biosynthesis protein G [Paracoccaceae bacterium]
MDRRSFLAVAASFAGIGPAAAQQASAANGISLGAAIPFSRVALESMAQALSANSYSPRVTVPQAWRDMTYDQYRLFWFNERNALWQGSARPARVDFFLPGLYFPNAVQVHVVENGAARPLAFDLSAFDRTDKAPDLPVNETLGYSGFRLRGEISEPGIFQEYAVFQGASYFRALGRGQVYGLSARGLALNTGDAQGEEFPDFISFWIEVPTPGSPTVAVHALLDSPSVTGAYTLVIRPGPTTTMQVDVKLFPRVDLGHVGLGSLTSMFLFDETDHTRFDDFRPQVHDSDGLLIYNGAGEMLWRALANPRSLQVSSFVDENPRGFGLMQRARAFSDFADLEAKYDLRPSLWVEPGAGWGKGAVTLVEIPSDKEIYDNIVAYWRPRSPLVAGQAHEFGYTLRWGGEPEAVRDVARVANTRMGGNAFGKGRIAVIEYAPHPGLPDDLSQLTLHTSGNAGTVSAGQVQRDPVTGAARLIFSFDPGTATSVELRAQIMLANVPLTEVWLYRWTA